MAASRLRRRSLASWIGLARWSSSLTADSLTVRKLRFISVVARSGSFHPYIHQNTNCFISQPPPSHSATIHIVPSDPITRGDDPGSSRISRISRIKDQEIYFRLHAGRRNAVLDGFNLFQDEEIAAEGAFPRPVGVVIR